MRKSLNSPPMSMPVEMSQWEIGGGGEEEEEHKGAAEGRGGEEKVRREE